MARRRKPVISPNQGTLFDSTPYGAVYSKEPLTKAPRVGRGQGRRQHQAPIFTEPQQARPGPWHPMASSRVNEARYDFGLNQVQVIFHDGTPWTYDTVSEELFNEFLASESPGRFINSTLNAYPYRRGDFSYSQGISQEPVPE